MNQQEIKENMTRKQKKHSLLVDLRYNQHILATRRTKARPSQLLPNFLKAIQNAFTKTNTAR